MRYSTSMIARYAHMRRQARVFRTLTGLTVAEFDTIAAEVLPPLQAIEHRRHARPDRQRAPGGGPLFQLDLRDQLLLTLVWLRQYPTHEALGFLFGVSDSTATRILARVRPVLAGWGSQQLPRYDPAPQRGRPTDALLRDLPELAVIVDSFEQAVQRPQDRTEADTWYSGKKKQHTIKTQITIHRGSGLIGDMSESVRGPTADLTLLKESGVAEGLPAWVGLEGDLAYVGVDKVHPQGKGATPRRKPRGKERPAEDKVYNRAFAQRRIEVEHAIGQVRQYQAVSQRDRDHRQYHPQRELAIAGVVNRRKQARWAAAEA